MDLSVRFLRTIEAYFGKYDENEIRKCIDHTYEATHVSRTEIVNRLQDSLPTVHLYIEELDSDLQLYFKLSQKLITFLINQDWKIIGFLGEGAEADVFRAINLRNGKEGAILLQSINLDFTDVSSTFNEKYKELWDIQKKGNPFGNTYVDIYDILHTSHPYSENIDYINHSLPNFDKRSVLILEVAPFTLDNYVKNVQDMDKFKQIFYPKYKALLESISGAGYEYTDMKAENIAVFPNKSKLCDTLFFDIKLIDIGTFRKVPKQEAKDRFNQLLDFDVFLTID
jgi:hypothetical protein